MHTTRMTIAARFLLAAALWPVSALAPASAPAFAQTQPAPAPAQIDKNGVLMLVRSTLIALQQANETGNYTVLRDLGAPGFQQANTAVRLGEIFASLRAQKLDLSGVSVLDPQLTLLPQIEANGMMHMAGFFPSVPTQINFEMLYAPVDGRWRLFGLSVKLGSSAPVAPAAPSPPPVAAATPLKKKLEPARRRKAPSKPKGPDDGPGGP